MDLKMVHNCTMVDSVLTVVEFHCESDEINSVLDPNEPPKENFFFISCQLRSEPSKNGHSQ